MRPARVPSFFSTANPNPNGGVMMRRIELVAESLELQHQLLSVGQRLTLRCGRSGVPSGCSVATRTATPTSRRRAFSSSGWSMRRRCGGMPPRMLIVLHSIGKLLELLGR